MQLMKLYICAVFAVSVLVLCNILWKTCDLQRPKGGYLKTETFKSTEAYRPETLGSNDYHQLINLRNFSFGILSLCDKSSLLLLVVVHSHPKNFEKRQTIRETWGKNHKNVKTVFMAAFSEDTKFEKQLSEEHEKYGDIVQGSFVEHYRNLTYKHIMSFKYGLYHCPHAKYILKTDDDVLVNMPLMRYFLQTDFFLYGGSNILACSLMKRNRVIREKSKWQVSFEEYPNKMYPPHCSGFAILYSSDVVFQLYKEAQNTQYFWIDDVYVTGIVAQKLNLSHVDFSDLVLNQEESSNPAKIRKVFLLGGYNVNVMKIKELWKYIMKRSMYMSMTHTVDSTLSNN